MINMLIQRVVIPALGLCIALSVPVFGSQGMWTHNGVKICNEAGTQYFPQMVSDDSGGAIIVWRDDRGSDTDIYAQRVDSDGTIHTGIVWEAIPLTCLDLMTRLIFRNRSNADIFAQVLQIGTDTLYETKKIIREWGRRL